MKDIVSVKIIATDSEGNESVIDVPKVKNFKFDHRYSDAEFWTDPFSWGGKTLIRGPQLIGLELLVSPEPFNESGHLYMITQKVK